MKKIMIFCMSLLFVCSYTQTLPTSETSTLDDKLVNIDKSSVTSGILYQRSSIFTRLYDFNKSSDFNTADAPFFEQSLTDLNYGSNQTKFIDYLGLRQLTIANKYKDNVVDIGIINTPFHMLYYDEESQSNGGLSFNTSTNLFVKNNNGKPAFLELFTTIISPLKKEAKGTSVTFKFKSNLNFFNGSKTIKSLHADFGDGISRMITGDGLFKPASFIINYSESGTKRIKFDIVYWDETTLTTYGSFYFTYSPPNFQISDVLALKSSAKTNLCNGESLANDFSIVSDTEFKGYDEPFSFKGKFDYRILYRTGGTDRKIRKPIIILDGFDPGDKRKIFGCEMPGYKPGETFSIQDMMTYIKNINGETIRQDLIKELRDKGYDVTIVNHPTYCVSNIAPYNIVPCGTANSREVDGGADYIERNALTLATLIKNFNSELRSNGSTEKLAIVGPSMGGQTSRYALSYLEKQGIDHNTRLWISVDSPHLGANIPLGDQALINLLATTGKSVEAADFYDKQLGSPAARQQLIEFHRDNPNHHQVNNDNLNGRTIYQGFNSNSGNSFYQQFYDNQFANGLPNSKGYPINLRKIALANGSLTGKTIGTDSEKVLNIRGFQRVNINLPIGSITFTIHIASLESHFMPSYNVGSQRVSRFKKGFDDRTTIAPNINSRGNMDTVPGGWFPAQKDIANSVLGTSPIPTGGSFWGNPLGNISDFIGGSYFELRDFRFNHSFISTFSALGHLQPNQNWGNPLNFNLACSSNKLTPFDSYYGSSENTQHTSFTEESVKWLMKELDAQPQSPWFPIKTDAFQGADKLCLNQTATYSLPNDCTMPSKATWTVSSNLQIISFTDYTVNVKAIYNGSATITATFQNGQTITKTIYLGTPFVKIPNAACGNPYDTVCFNYGYYPYNQTFQQVVEGIGMEANQNIYTDYEWEMVTGNSTFVNSTPGSNGRKFTGNLVTIFAQDTSIQVRARGKNNCGWGAWKYIFFNNYGGKTDIVNTEFFTVSPNPANDFINIALVNQYNTPASKNDIQVELYNSLGSKQKTVKLNNNKATMSVNGLLQGVYTLKIIYDDKVESHQVIIK
ncbi:T9SS type A sorting domain-containing protein [Chryseobacterium sp. FH1]|uniref:T9SS type A sorting domain-containing protein n=1 Tax=Chryseobacterium sp. FH1 TaxID=1233951 RepID=UPI0004E39A2E|nr:T9SS type A sorting domain-containing protein [Chryseobacterium sp. FH1]KFC18821.1 hypothetical protein IO90_17705 [Chryseobacterium sp. FH1]